MMQITNKVTSPEISHPPFASFIEHQPNQTFNSWLVSYRIITKLKPSRSVTDAEDFTCCLASTSCACLLSICIPLQYGVKLTGQSFPIYNNDKESKKQRLKAL